MVNLVAHARKSDHKMRKNGQNDVTGVKKLKKMDQKWVLSDIFWH